MPTNLDTDCLRTFAAIATMGSFAKAAERVGRSVPAVSLQINRLEDQVGTRLFRKQGRRMVLSVAGEELLGHARSILRANDSAVQAFSDTDFSGTVRMGAPQDLAEDVMPAVLAAFSERYPQTRIEMLIERSRILVDAVETNKIDQAIAFKQQTPLKSKLLSRRPMVWVAAKDSDLAKLRPLPLILMEGPCAFREAALAVLGDADIPWRTALSSPSLACLAAAAEAGAGLMIRTREILNSRWSNLQEITGLPKLPRAELRLYQGPTSVSLAARRLSEMIAENIASH